MSFHKGILGQQFGGATVNNDQTLGDYIARKQRQEAFDVVAQEKKMTFDEWWKEFSQRYSLDDCDSLCVDFQRCWEAAQENK